MSASTAGSFHSNCISVSIQKYKMHFAQFSTAQDDWTGPLNVENPLLPATFRVDATEGGQPC